MIQMEQIHGNRVVLVTKKDDGKIIKNCDALITNDPDATLSVRVADCLPIAVFDEKSHTIGLIHAGWRGLANGIIKNTVELMHQKLKIVNCDLKIVIGPHICAKHYDQDLAKNAVNQLISLGVKKENIKIDKKCTFEDENLFSYRRNKTSERNIFTISISKPYFVTT